jgi:hypothetical protein
MQLSMTTQPAANYTGTLTDDCHALTLWGSSWEAPTKAWRKLCGQFGESLVRTIVCNSRHAFSPSTIAEADAQVIAKVCASAPAETEGK